MISNGILAEYALLPQMPPIPVRVASTNATSEITDFQNVTMPLNCFKNERNHNKSN